MKHFDTIVIGFGKGGKTTAGLLGKQGKEVAVIEKSDRMYGGTCINIGCIPSKSLVTWSNRKQVKEGMTLSEEKKYFQQAMERKEQLTAKLRQKNYAMLQNMDTVNVIDGEAHFIDPHTIEVVNGDTKTQYSADRFVINTGANPAMINIPGVKESQRVVLSEGMLSLPELPEELVIIGGGYIGLEFASMYTAFGSKVTVLEGLPQFLYREDEDVAQAIRESLEARGVTIHTGVKVKQVIDGEEISEVHYSLDGKDYVAKANTILLATGRRPNTDGLNLDKAGVKVGERGNIIVDKYSKTSADHIWAVGDVTGGLQFTYVSLDDFRILRDQFTDAPEKHTNENRLVPYSVFIEPPFSRVGMSEKEAKENGYDFVVVKMAAQGIPKANVLQRTTGLLKALVDRKDGKILGCVLFCEESHEMINIVKTVMDLGGTYKTLRDQIFTHPTMSEALNDLFNQVTL